MPKPALPGQGETPELGEGVYDEALAVGLFSLSPSLPFDYLQTETDAFRKSLASRRPSGESPPSK